MVRKAFLSVSFQGRKGLQAEFDTVFQVLSRFQIEVVDFVAQFPFGASDEQEMMSLAFAEIASSDLLIAEVSEKAIGVGIEIGYAKALHKPIIYLRKANTEYSTTVGGIATETLIYENLDDLNLKLTQAVMKVTQA